MSITAAEQWADAIEAEQNGYDWDKFSLSYSSGRAAGVELNVEADDNFGRRFTSADGQWIVEYDETSGHWYGETRSSEKHTTRVDHFQEGVWQPVCSRCGNIGPGERYRQDAIGIADRHMDIGGFG